MAAAGSQKARLSELFSLLDKYSAQGKARERFVINRQIIEILDSSERVDAKIQFLTSITDAFPDDMFNAYYLAVVAQTYQQTGASRFAAYYYDRILKNYPDLDFRGEYVHELCLRQIANLATRPEERANACLEMLQRFDDESSRPELLFRLAREYEQMSDWEKARKTYEEFVMLKKTVIPGFPDAWEQVQDKLAMFTNKPDWVVGDLNVLVRKIRTAIGEKDVETLQALRAKGYFFTITWEQNKSDMANFFSVISVADYLGVFLANSDVKVAPELDADSNAREAFLRTERWEFRIHSTWYFYFRRVDFGPDPDINGGWEWAGIYFGEKL